MGSLDLVWGYFNDVARPMVADYVFTFTLFSSQFTKMQVSFARDLIFRTMNKFFHT